MPSSINSGRTIRAGGARSSSPAGICTKTLRPGQLLLSLISCTHVAQSKCKQRSWRSEHSPHIQAKPTHVAAFCVRIDVFLTPATASAMHRHSAHGQWRAAPAPPTCSSSRVLPVPVSRSQRAAKAGASRATEDGARQWLAATATNTARSRCRPVAAGRDAPVLEAVDFPQGWQGGQASEESDRHVASTNGHSSSAEPSSLAHAATVVAEAIPTTEASIAARSAAVVDSTEQGSVQPSELARGAGELHSSAGGPASSAAAAGAASATEAADSLQPAEPFQGLGELADIEELRGVRVSVDGNGKAVVEYLVHWKVGCWPLCVGRWCASCAWVEEPTTDAVSEPLHRSNRPST